MPLATHTGILSCLQSTVPSGTASARKHCSSTTHRCDPYTLCQLIRFLASTRLRRDDALAQPLPFWGQILAYWESTRLRRDDALTLGCLGTRITAMNPLLRCQV